MYHPINKVTIRDAVCGFADQLQMLLVPLLLAVAIHGRWIGLEVVLLRVSAISLPNAEWIS